MPAIGFTDVFDEVTVLLLLTAAVGVIILKLRQPLIIGFIFVGILIGPSGFGWVSSSGPIHLMAQLGLSLLLFVVGLRLDVGLIKSTGPVALATGLGQVAFTTIGGYLLALALGLPNISALYVAVALTFSSTIIIVKLLSDKHELDALHGRIAIGFLIVQDIVVVLAMIILSSLAGKSGYSAGYQILYILIKALGLVVILGLLMYFIIPRLMNLLAHSPELLVLFAIAWAVSLSNLSDELGFSKEVGAFLAGVSLASTPFREILAARLVTLRDFLVLFFFIELGTRLDFNGLGEQVWAAIPLSIFVLVGNPLIVMIIMGLMGYRKRTSFLAGLTVAQISEFSLVLMALGLRLRHVNEGDVGLVTLVGLVTIGLSTYMILYSRQLYDRLSPYLQIFERKIPHKEQAEDTEASTAQRADIIMYGLGRYGTNITQHLIAQGRTVLGIDFDPQAVKNWNKRGWIAWFGDAEDPEFLAALPLNNAKWVISSIRDKDINRALIKSLCAYGYKGNIAVTAYSKNQVSKYMKEGADLVFVPYSDAASHAVDLINIAEAEEARRKMDKVIANLKDHYIVCGYGRMGQHIVKDLLQHNVPFVVIEWNPEQIPRLQEDGVPFIEGKATDDETLMRARVDKAKGLVAVTATDEENVFIVLTARGLNKNLFIVARSIQRENEDKLKRAGADKVISPYVLGGHRIATAVLKPRVMDFLDVAIYGDTGELEIGDVRVTESAPFVGKALKDSKIRETTGVTVLAIRHDDETVIHPNPSPDHVIQADDELIVMGSREQVDALEKMIGAV